MRGASRAGHPLATVRKCGILYYYDRMFTLCYMLHLLFTGQDVHDLKLHITEQENVHFEPKLLVGRLDRWLTESPVARLGGRQSTY